MVKFRFVIVDDFDNVIEVLVESPEYTDRWRKEWSDFEYQTLLELDNKYNFNDWENVPTIETQKFENGCWKFHSNTLEDWFNL